MDGSRFDTLTRRYVLGSLGGGGLAALLGRNQTGAKKGKGKSKRKRCRKKKRPFCAGRCCPNEHRCENKACVQSCSHPLSCTTFGTLCGQDNTCACLETAAGDSACVARPPGNPLCSALTPCTGSDACPAGQLCVTCDCPVATPDRRCFSPCPPG